MTNEELLEKIRDEINQRIEEIDDSIFRLGVNESERIGLYSQKDNYIDLLSFLNTLQIDESEEIDLIKEYDEQFWNDPVYNKLVNRNAGLAIAHHFYKLWRAQK